MRSMWKSLLIFTLTISLIAFGVFAGGFVSFGQVNYQKIGGDVVQDVQDAAGQTSQNLAQGMAGAAPPGDAPAAPEGTSASPGGTAGQKEAVPEELTEDKLREAISAVNEFSMFADSASKVVRAYIRKIKIKQSTEEEVRFEEGHEPWLSKRWETRYSPFDPQINLPPPIPPDIKPQQPTLPPLGKAPTGPNIEDLRSLVNLKMTSYMGDEIVALAEIAGVPVTLRTGDTLNYPGVVNITVEEVALDAVMLRAGTGVIRVPFAGPSANTEEKPFVIEIE